MAREPIHFTLNDYYAKGMEAAQATAKTYRQQIEMDQATWEPHDWQEW